MHHPSQMTASSKVFFLFIIAISWIGSSNHIADAYQTAVATWYDNPSEYGSGGACGLENDIRNPPFSGKITAGNQALFNHGKGCNTCYEVKCKENPDCSGIPVRVTLTDECPGTCNNDGVHFDLSRIAFGHLAKPGHDQSLIKAGRINVQYRRVPCNYGGTPIVFKVDKGSNEYFFDTAIEYQNGEGDLSSVEIKPEGSNQWFPMQQSFGATYKFDVPSGTKGPFSIRLKTMKGRTIMAQDVIPAGWKPGGYYKSKINFSPMI